MEIRILFTIAGKLFIGRIFPETADVRKMFYLVEDIKQNIEWIAIREWRLENREKKGRGVYDSLTKLDFRPRLLIKNAWALLPLINSL